MLFKIVLVISFFVMNSTATYETPESAPYYNTLAACEIDKAKLKDNILLAFGDTIKSLDCVPVGDPHEMP